HPPPGRALRRARPRAPDETGPGPSLARGAGRADRPPHRPRGLPPRRGRPGGGVKHRPARPEEKRESGLAAEGLAASFLEERGWEILARNHHCRGGEVDLVVGKGRTIAFVEVRSR